MKVKIQKALELFDLPGGVILGLWSLAYLVTYCASMWVYFHTDKVYDIPSGWKEVYNWLLTAFAASKTLRTMFGKVTGENEKPA